MRTLRWLQICYLILRPCLEAGFCVNGQTISPEMFLSVTLGRHICCVRWWCECVDSDTLTHSPVSDRENTLTADAQPTRLFTPAEMIQCCPIKKNLITEQIKMQVVWWKDVLRLVYGFTFRPDRVHCLISLQKQAASCSLHCVKNPVCLR